MNVKRKSIQKKSTSAVAGAMRTNSGDGARKSLEARFKAVFENSRDAIGVSKAGVHVFVNPAYLVLFGFPHETDLAGKPVLDLIAPDSRDQVKNQILRRVRGESAPSTYETRGLRTDASEFTMEVNVTLYQENGEEHTLVILRDITERKRAEDVLRISEDKFRKVFLTSPDAINVNRLDDGMYISINHGFTDTTGYTAADVAGKTSLELNLWVDSADRQNLVQGLRARGEIKNLEAQFRLKDGSIINGLMSASIIEIDHVPHIVSVTRDITKYKQFDAALKQSEAKYRRIYNETPVLLHSIDRNGIVVDVNDYWLKTMGYERGEVLGKKVTDFYTPASRKYAREIVQPAFFRDGIAKDIPYQFVKKNGELIDVVLSATAERDDSGNVVRSLAVIIDITERKQAEEALRQSEARFKAITATASDAILLMNEKGKIVYWNPSAERIFGYSADEANGQDLHNFLAPERLHGDYLKGFSRFVTTGQGPVINRSVEMTAKKKDGKEFPIEISTSAMNINGKWHALGIVRDITERKRSEEALRENKEQLDLALQSAHMGVWRLEIKENRRSFDDLTCQLLGIDVATFHGTAAEFFETVHPEDRLMIQSALSRTLEQDALYDPSYRVVWPDGSIRYVTSRGRLVRDSMGHPARINGLLWDITDQHLLEQELIKAQKLESIGTLAGGIAHDFNNLLQGIFGYISMAKLTINEREKSLGMLEQAEKALHQSVNLTSQLLTFSKGGKPIKKVFALRPVIENAAKFALSGSRVVPEIVIADDLCTVDADEGQIGQVIQNIVLNADQAMPLGGTITIKAENVAASSLQSRTIDADGMLVSVSVQDRGTGIPQEHLSRIFDPYFTTKEKGSGLGLATSYSIARNHGGTLMASSELGAGSTFTLYLPASAATAVQAEPSQESPTNRQGRILVMDDEEIVRSVTGELVRQLGHEVAFAAHGASAVQQYTQAMKEGRPFDIVILDLTIRGGMGGVDTAARLNEIDPRVKTIVSSGYSDDAGMADYLKKGFKAFLKKPYNIKELREVLNDLME